MEYGTYQVYEVYMFCVVLVDLCAFVGCSITCKNDAQSM
jgi:hypothetical protein